MNILLIEDNLNIIKGLKYTLEKNNYQLNFLTTIKEATDFLKVKPHIDLIILDVTLPDGNGFDFYEFQLKNLAIPTLFLTAKDEEDDIVKGLNLGAEDYIIKPFSTKELLARIKRILLRYKKQGLITVKDITFDLNKMVVFKNQQIIDLTSLELKLLHLLFINLNRVVSRSTILSYIWDWTGNDVDDHTVTVYFQRIRNKLQTDIITTVKGIGYRIDEK